MTQTKIAHITTVDLSLRYLLLNQLSSIRDAGNEIVGISAPGPEVSIVEAAGIRHIAIPMTRRFTPWADTVSLWRLYRVMRRERFTIVHTHTPKGNLFGQLAARLANVPIRVATVHGFYFTTDTPLLKRLFFQMIETISLCFSDVVFLINREDVQTARQLHICSSTKVRHLSGGIGIDVQQFDPASLAPETLAEKRRELGLPADAPVVGFVGRLVAEKGVPELLAAARIVAERLPGVRFLFVGAIDREKPDAITPELAAEYGLGEVCVFAGQRDDMPEMYGLMDVFVLPSHREGFPRSPMEASAMGVPCVLTDIRGCREAVIHEQNGLLVPLGDVSTLADAISALLTDCNKARQLGKAGRQMALERFDEREVFRKVKDEYARLLMEKGLGLPARPAVR